jgi:hypothetical protein
MTGENKILTEVMKMRKKFLACFAVVLFSAVFAVAGSEAAKKNFGAITADVPDGWTVEDSDEQITFMAPGNEAALTIIAGATEGAPLKDIAQELSKELGGSAPKESDGGYGFSFKTPEGIECPTFITADEDLGMYMCIMVAGEHPQMEALIDSIAYKE